MMIEKSQNEGTNKVIMRQLKNQVTMKMVITVMVMMMMDNSRNEAK